MSFKWLQRSKNGWRKVNASFWEGWLVHQGILYQRCWSRYFPNDSAKPCRYGIRIAYVVGSRRGQLGIGSYKERSRFASARRGFRCNNSESAPDGMWEIHGEALRSQRSATRLQSRGCDGIPRGATLAGDAIIHISFTRTWIVRSTEAPPQTKLQHQSGLALIREYSPPPPKAKPVVQFLQRTPTADKSTVRSGTWAARAAAAAPNSSNRQARAAQPTAPNSNMDLMQQFQQMLNTTLAPMQARMESFENVVS